VKTGSNVTEPFKEGFGSKSADLPMMMMINILVLLVLWLCFLETGD
jgi:hypothetical protein